MILAAVGLSHKTAPLLTRERLAFSDAEVPGALSALCAIPGVAECVLLSTCNRTEVYLLASQPALERIAPLVADLKGQPAADYGPAFEVRRGPDACRHVLRVAAGLESQVVGEPQILGQVRRAFETARRRGTTGATLNRLMQMAVATGRRVRHETGLAGAAASIPHAALRYLRRRWGALDRRRILIAGGGEMAALALKIFSASGARVLAVANRTVETAALLAGRFGTQAVPLESIPDLLPRADGVLVAMGGGPSLTAAHFALAASRRTPLLVLDLSVPRAIDDAVAALPGVVVHDLDALGPAGTPAPALEDDLRRADQIIEGVLAAFARWQASRAAVPLISALRARTDRIIDAEIARMRGTLSGLPAPEQEAVYQAMRAAVRKALHLPIVRLRESAAADQGLVQLARELFDLDGVEARDA